MFFFPERTVVLAPCDQPRDRHLGASAGIAIGPLAELRRLRAVERHASREALEEAARVVCSRPGQRQLKIDDTNIDNLRLSHDDTTPYDQRSPAR
jgi:hypothetical protein